MDDSRLTKEEADKLKQLLAEAEKLRAKAAKPRKTKKQRQLDEFAEKIAPFDIGEVALCKELGNEPMIEFTNKALQASAAKLYAAGLVSIHGDESGKLYAKAKTHWYGVAMGDLK